ncbi:hypothetical protein [Marasmitruncus massiliensis]|uniref:hypothetical protein n=1 Tax=Marasmitruncus massiliensis TaxID=1944642 RepID=UPI000C7E1297|nr:hypothetical protein [Marasmitruncus massiliensis]
MRDINLIAREQDGANQYYPFNAHGDVIQRTDAWGNVLKDYRYDAFGNERKQLKNLSLRNLKKANFTVIALLHLSSIQHMRILKAFPMLKPTRYSNAWQKFKQALQTTDNRGTR